MVCTIAAGATAEYYLQEQGEYYVDGKEPKGSWYAPDESFGLHNSAEVTASDFLHLHAGENLKGEVLIPSPGAFRNRVAAYDMTFSAPKSVSVLAAVSDEQTRTIIEQAQEKAVRDALDMLNEHAAFARRGKGGVSLESVRLTAALFQHGEARPVGKDAFDLSSDPQLHTHAVILNLAERTDDTVGALDGRHLFRWKMAAGAQYRASLANELQQRLGVQIDRTDATGLFEVKGVPKHVRDHFSQRRAEIVSKLEDLGLTPKGASATTAKLTKATRTSKEAVFESRPDQLVRWRREASELGFAEAEWKNCLGHNVDKALQDRLFDDRMKQVLPELMAHESVFQHKDIMAKVAAAATGAGKTQLEITQAIDQLVQSEQVVFLEPDATGQAVYSTKGQIALEVDVQKIAGQLAESKHHSLSVSSVSSKLSETVLSIEQQEAVISGATGADLVVIEGAAGSGKSFSLRTLSALYGQEGYRVIGCATAWKTSNQLASDCNIESRATDAWLARAQSGGQFLDQQTVLIVDEAGQLSARQMQQILSAAQSAQAKVILTGDSKQLQSVGAGPGLQLVSEKTGVTRIDTARRQEQLWARSASQHFASGNADAAIRAYDQHGLLNLCDGHTAVLRSAVEAWAEDKRLFPQNSSLVIARTNKEVSELNAMMRVNLQQTGYLGRDQILVNAEKGGAIVIAQGEHMRFTRKINTLGVVNGTEAKVISINNRRQLNPILSLQIGGRSAEVNLAALVDKKGSLPLSYAYASTLYAAQGATVDKAYVVASSAMKRSDIYVATSRARKSTRLFVDRDKLARSVLDGKLLANRKQPDLSNTVLKKQLSFSWSKLREKVSALDYLPSSTKILEIARSTKPKDKLPTIDR
ncbi:MobF family relaxase [Kordiimonas aquimaris]|uniref:MobF family relaxase n=1 Tax=Kordiimonas aquimaris TaxID=707591 RepID=UPI0021CFE8BB|nr:MobF family relaxase [Kordiimonas aquimaris]